MTSFSFGLFLGLSAFLMMAGIFIRTMEVLRSAVPATKPKVAKSKTASRS